MSSIPAIALYSTPIIASNAIFSCRRASRGINALEENPAYAAVNFDIAAGQTFKGINAANDLISTTNSSIVQATQSASESIKNLSKTNKIVRGAGKLLKFTANNINPIIIFGSGVEIAGSEKKVDTAAEEILSLGGMFAAEGITKNAIGMPYTENGEKKLRQAFFDKELKNFDKYCQEKKLFNKIPLKYAPGAAKGLVFVGASIGGYKLGNSFAKTILENNESITNAA
jgi:hypothetical protein